MQTTSRDFSNQRDPLLVHSNGELVQRPGRLGTISVVRLTQCQ
jgi:hypothetical protein